MDARLKPGHGGFRVAKKVRQPELIGISPEDDWFDYRFENDPRFLKRVGEARKSLRAGRGVKLEDVKI